MTLRQAVASIRSMFRLISSDNDISDRAIAAELKSTSLDLIKRETDKRKLFSSNNLFTTIPCLEMEPVSIAECCDYDSPCMVSRSKVKIPKIAENVYGYLVQGVFSIDGKVKFNYKDPTRYVNLLKAYPKGEYKEHVFWIYDDRVYTNLEGLEKIKLAALFEEDVWMNDYNCSCETDECPQNPLDVEFHCPGYLLKRCFDLVRDTMLKTYERSTSDHTENDIDEQKTN